MPTTQIAFSRPYRTTRELANLSAVLKSGHVQGDGPFTKSASAKLKSITGAKNLLLTTSGSHALDMASLLLNFGPGDEVIMPSFTFSSGANSIALTGARIVFVDIEPTTGNINAELVRKNLTNRTRAISIVHYGGVAADMESLLDISVENCLPIIEDNAHGLGGKWRGQILGGFGALAIQSFHDTKNIHCGEGGALVINDQNLMNRAEVIREKGTDRSRFLRGQIDKYSWTDIGSSYLPSELNAAVLDSQLDEFVKIQTMRHDIWNSYLLELEEWAGQQAVTLMNVPGDREHTAHLFYVLMPTQADQGKLITHLKNLGIVATFHFVPLDSSTAGRKYGTAPLPCQVSQDFSARIVRLPLWAGLSESAVQRVVDGVRSFRTGR